MFDNVPPICNDDIKSKIILFPGEKDCADSWLQCENSCYLAVSVVACGSRSIAPSSLVTMSVIECEKMGQWHFDVPRSRMLQPRFRRLKCTQS